MLRKIANDKRIILAIASGALLSLGFPPINLWPAAYISFVPLFFALEDILKKEEAFALSYICGLVFFGITMFWLRHVSILGGLLLIAVLSVFFGLFGLYFLSAIRYPLSAIVFLPACWAVLEYARSNLFTGFGWALLGYSQYLNLPMIQIADLTGAYGVSFVVMMMNVLIYSLFSNGLRKNLVQFSVSIVILCAVLWYGHDRLKETALGQETLRISVVQGNIPQEIKWDAHERDAIFAKYSRLTKDASGESPALIIWPETSLPGFVEEEDLLEKTKSLARESAAYLLIGAPSFTSLHPEGVTRLTDLPEEALYNSAILISKNGDILGQYNKLHPVPFGEYVPFDRYIGFIRKFINKPIGEFAKGGEYTIFTLENGARFGVLICFEDIFSNLVRAFVLRRVDFMVNITNDAWFKKTQAPYQHAQSSVFRAVENRIPVVRAANTGLSCFIDRYGRIYDSVRVNNEETFVAGYKTGEIHLDGGRSYLLAGRSFYSLYGDVFAIICAMMILIKGGLVWLRKL